jgi:hypothetical protein
VANSFGSFASGPGKVNPFCWLDFSLLDLFSCHWRFGPQNLLKISTGEIELICEKTTPAFAGVDNLSICNILEIENLSNDFAFI